MVRASIRSKRLAAWRAWMLTGLMLCGLVHADDASLAEPVRFRGGESGIDLAGVLERPAWQARDQALPAVVLIHGSGPNDRDETLYGHKPFRLLSAWLTAAGYAVLRYDKRGVGESGGTAQGATILDFAADAEAAFDFLRSRPDIDGGVIWLKKEKAAVCDSL